MKRTQVPVPLDWYLHVGALVLASLLLVAVPDSIAQHVIALFSGEPIGSVTSIQASLESGNFAGTELDAEQVQNAAAIINKGREMGASDRDITIGYDNDSCKIVSRQASEPYVAILLAIERLYYDSSQ